MLGFYTRDGSAKLVKTGTVQQSI